MFLCNKCDKYERLKLQANEVIHYYIMHRRVQKMRERDECDEMVKNLLCPSRNIQFAAMIFQSISIIQ